MKIADYIRRYRDNTTGILKAHERKQAMSLAVGGDFEGMGKLEYLHLQHLGMRPGHMLIDVGCGSGRLAYQMRGTHGPGYLGLDVVPEMLDYAREICARPDWRFAQAPGLTLPVLDASADFVCFYSVLTHLLHEDSYRYLRDARRALKPDGRIVFSYLDFGVDAHWPAFEAALARADTDAVTNQFISADAINAWARHLDLKVHGIWRGDEEHFPLVAPVQFDSGAFATVGSIGQSICVMGLP